MNSFKKNFFFGLGAGILLTIVLIIGRGYGIMSWFSRGGPEKQGMTPETSLEVPPFPSGAFADYNWTVKSLDGQDFSMAQVKGKVVFMNFWATWCPHCVDEMPNIQRLYENIKDDRIAFVCISQDTSAKAGHFVKEKGLTFPVYTLQGLPPSCFLTRGIPATFIISSDGRIAFKHVGAAKWDDEKSIEFLKGLLPEKP